MKGRNSIDYPEKGDLFRIKTRNYEVHPENGGLFRMKGMNSRVGLEKDPGSRGHKGEFFNSSGERAGFPDEREKFH